MSHQRLVYGPQIVKQQLCPVTYANELQRLGPNGYQMSHKSS